MTYPMTGLRIVIVTYNWPPRNAIGTHRPYAWAKYWQEAGAEVTVVTAVKRSFDSPLDLQLPPIPGVETIEVSYGGKAGYLDVLLKSEWARLLARRVKRWLTKNGELSVDPRLAWRKAAQAVTKQLATKADIVISTYGPAAAHLIGYDMKIANPELRWVADYRDLWSQSHTSDVSQKTRLSMRNIELDTVGAYADLLIGVSYDMVNRLSSLTGKDVFYVPNGFDIDEEQVLLRSREKLEKPSGPMNIVYTGMIYEGYRDPTPLLSALSELYSEGYIKDGDVTVDFYGDKVNLAKRLSQNANFAPFIRLMGHVTRDKALAAQREAGLLLLLESSAPEASGVLTGKLFEYMTAGRPILCVGSRPEYEIGKILAATGTGRVFGPDEFSSLKSVLFETLKGNGLYESYSPNFYEILRYSRKRQAIKLLQMIVDGNRGPSVYAVR